MMADDKATPGIEFNSLEIAISWTELLNIFFFSNVFVTTLLSLFDSHFPFLICGQGAFVPHQLIAAAEARLRQTATAAESCRGRKATFPFFRNLPVLPCRVP
jgi:hypothetical protein